jgi:hypothetical protein
VNAEIISEVLGGFASFEGLETTGAGVLPVDDSRSR